MEKIKVMAVVGPTASGKTDLAAALAEKYGGEVVSCDSMQIYKKLSIATAKPTKAEMRGIPHHLIDFVEPTENFSVADYVKSAKPVISDIAARSKLPVICGGTGLYFSALVDNICFSDVGSDPLYREKLRKRAAEYGAQSLLDELAQYDPEAAAKLHPHNLSRIIRAMEHYKLSGVTISEQNRLSRINPSQYEPLIFEIDYHDRQKLYDRINLRVDKMIDNGLIEETRWYFSHRDFGTASAAIGYKELEKYISGESTLEDAKEDLKRETRHFAKRQLTWFRKDTRIHRLYADEATDKTLLERAAEITEDEKFLQL